MFAVILAGGAGTRLRPLTYARRKELVPVLNRPLLEYRLRNLAEHRVTDVVIACSQGMGEVEEHFGDGADLGLRITYTYEDRMLGSGRAAKEAARAAGASGTLVVCNGDILTNLDLTAMLERHRWAGATVSVSLAPVDDPWAYGVVAVDDSLAITRFVEKPPAGEEPSNLINAGTWIFEPEVLERVPDDESAIRDGFAERVLFPGIIADGRRMQGFVEDLWVDVGSPERYLRANRLLLERRADAEGTRVFGREQARVSDGAEIAGLVLLGAKAQVSEGARIAGPTVLGDNVAVGPSAVVEGSVIWERTAVGEGARVSNSIIGARVAVGAGSVLVDAVVADGVAIEAGQTLDPGARIMPNERVPA